MSFFSSFDLCNIAREVGELAASQIKDDTQKVEKHEALRQFLDNEIAINGEYFADYITHNYLESLEDDESNRIRVLIQIRQGLRQYTNSASFPDSLFDCYRITKINKKKHRPKRMRNQFSSLSLSSLSSFGSSFDSSDDNDNDSETSSFGSLLNLLNSN